MSTTERRTDNRSGLGQPLRDRLRPGPLTLARRYLLATLGVVAIGSVVVAALVGALIEAGALNRTASLAALYVESFVEPQVQGLANRSKLEPAEVAAIQKLLTATSLGEKVVSLRVWSPSGEILYSPNAALIGQRFEVDANLDRALEGLVSVNLSDLDESENEYERQHWSRLLEMYFPVRERGGDRIIAVTEFYQLPDELEAEVNGGRLAAWGLVAMAALVAYLLLARIVHGGSLTIARQEAALRRQVTTLTSLLEQNAALHGRVRHAAARATTLSEQERRRISSDLHDGPVQALALAMLRMDALAGRESSNGSTEIPVDLNVVRRALTDALAEMRAIAAGLRTPRLADASPEEVIRRAVSDHRRRTGKLVLEQFADLPLEAPLPTKIAMFRILQEALSNAERHAGGRNIEVRSRAESRHLELGISDEGPGFDPSAVPAEGHLGLAGMRERAEVLGGRFELLTAPGRGTTVRVELPLDDGGVA